MAQGFIKSYGNNVNIPVPTTQGGTGLSSTNPSSGFITNSAGVASWAAYTGTGSPVLATSPTLSNPIITGSILDANGNNILSLTSNASSVNYTTFTNAPTGMSPTILANGSDTNITLLLSGKGTRGVNIIGCADGSNPAAASRYVGETISSVIPFGSAFGISNSTPTNVTSISLSAGDWDVWGNMYALSSGTGITNAAICINTVSATLTDQSLLGQFITTAGVAASGINAPKLRFNVGVTTTIYLVGFVAFSPGTVTVCGGLYARRRR